MNIEKIDIQEIIRIYTLNKLDVLLILTKKINEVIEKIDLDKQKANL